MPNETALNTQIDERLKEEVDIACIRRKKKLQEAVSEGLQIWIEGATNLESVDFGQLTEQEYSYMAATLQVLRQKPRGIHAGITGALDAWLIEHPVEKQSAKRKGSNNKRAG
jgi:hypothetical protein